ncbi:hypothetical protein [Streptomyces sp. NPDC048442]|uniref:hypothetical protein n=1 Tax=Streptomyces sp. NPDC048442 TaxID=3154823 RepID=UPI00343AFB89
MTGVIVLMLVAAWIIHRYLERPLGAWLNKALKRGITDVRKNTPARGNGRRRAARPLPQTPAAHPHPHPHPPAGIPRVSVPASHLAAGEPHPAFHEAPREHSLAP